MRVLIRLRRPTAHGEADTAAVAVTVLRLAVLLEAGVAPLRAWQHLAADGDRFAGRVCAAVEEGTTLAAAVKEAADSPGSAWGEVADAWGVATAVGAPLAQSLRSLAEALRDAHAAVDEVRVALAEPAATARLMSWLPLVAVGLGVALGFDTVGVLIDQPAGWGCLVAGLVLIALSRRWTQALDARAREQGALPGLSTELLAIALGGGVSIDRARAVVGSVGRRVDASAEAVLALSRSAGVPAVELLRAASALDRHQARVDARLRVARLSTRLLLPLGVCTLPAFLLLGVAPMLLSVMSSVPLTL